MSDFAAFALALAWLAAWTTHVQGEQWGDLLLLVVSSVCLCVGLAHT